MIISQHIYRPFKPICGEKVFKIPRCQAFDLNMEEFLVQGANPMNPYIHQLEGNFQGGYRCTLKVVTPPTFGTVVVSQDHLGFEYRPKSKYWFGKDSFSYSVVNIFGYESDAKCVYVVVDMK